jgi:hypothetical protein
MKKKGGANSHFCEWLVLQSTDVLQQSRNSMRWLARTRRFLRPPSATDRDDPLDDVRSHKLPILGAIAIVKGSRSAHRPGSRQGTELELIRSRRLLRRRSAVAVDSRAHTTIVPKSDGVLRLVVGCELLSSCSGPVCLKKNSSGLLLNFFFCREAAWKIKNGMADAVHH